ncbi:MAG: hypothetical protein LLG37_05680 [Spirochaetia bacterium]|nr:hypothetical protein [Spirochaetia bacterium]
MAEELKYEIVKNIGTFGEASGGWKKEVNVISWNDRKAKLDIRPWDGTHKKMGKGITLSKTELKALLQVLNAVDAETLGIE